MLAALPLALLIAALPGAPAAQAAISVGDVTIGETGAEASFTVTRTAGLLTGNAIVAFSTADETAHAPADYTALPPGGTLFFGSLALGGLQTQVVVTGHGVGPHEGRSGVRRSTGALIARTSHS